MVMDEIVKAIQCSNKIGITFHQSPDGDSLGSSTALLTGLRSMGKTAYIMSKEEVPSTFSYLSYSEEINGECRSIEKGTDLVIVLDCGDVKRINAEINFEDRKYKIINIDHHMSNEYYGDINYVSTKSAAVGEIIFDLLNELGVEITKSIGECIYTSILTDTSSFKHTNTTRKTHEVAGALVDIGINFNGIQRSVFENKEFDKVKFFGKVIDGITLEVGGKVAFMEITQDMLAKSSLASIDSSEVISFGTMIKGVEVVALFKESTEGVKGSLRSKTVVDVNKVAKNFNGGGHIRAAGFFFEGTMEEAKASLKKILEEELR